MRNSNRYYVRPIFSKIKTKDSLFLGSSRLFFNEIELITRGKIKTRSKFLKINDIKYLKKNKIFLILLERNNQDKKNQKISSILKFEFVDSSKSKNINQQDAKILLKLLAIKLFKVKKNYEITLLFSNNAIINLSAEIIEVTIPTPAEGPSFGVAPSGT